MDFKKQKVLIKETDRTRSQQDLYVMNDILKQPLVHAGKQEYGWRLAAASKPTRGLRNTHEQ